MTKKKHRLTEEDLENLESVILAEGLRGGHQWPISVRILGQTARLRLVRGKARIFFDWQVPEKYRSHFGRKRFLQQVPMPEVWVPGHQDPGHNPALAISWLETWLHDRIIEAGAAVAGMAGAMTHRTNDLLFTKLVEEFRASTHFKSKSKARQDEWNYWLDFLKFALGDDFRMYQVSPGILAKLVEAYQEKWVRTFSDGSTEEIIPCAKRNTAAKVVTFFGTVCRWGLCEPTGPDQYLLDKDPFLRIPKERIPRERSHTRRQAGAASDAFTSAIMDDLRNTGESGQALLIYSTEAALGRRPSEIRELPRNHLLTTAEEIEAALEVQGCRDELPDRAIPDHEIPDAARAYAKRGWAIHFRAGKALALHPEAGQFDRVVPLGRRLTDIYRSYLDEYWNSLTLPGAQWMCPAAQDLSKATSRHVAEQWFSRARARVAKLEDAPRPPAGGSHTLRHRFRATLRREEKKTVAFIAGWTVKQGGAMDRHYLPIPWGDIVDLIDLIDETTASVL